MRPDPLQQLREVHAVQGRDGCWDIDDYMLGLYNGLELALSLMEQRDVHYKKRKAIATEESSATQEPVAWAKRAAEWLLDLPNTRYDAPYFTNGMFKGDCQELADLLQKLTHPQPKREWVGLTDEERDEIYLNASTSIEMLKEVEAKLKDKNHAT